MARPEQVFDGLDRFGHEWWAPGDESTKACSLKSEGPLVRPKELSPVDAGVGALLFLFKSALYGEIEDIAQASSNFKAASLRVEGVSGPTLALFTSDNGGSNPEQVSEVLSVLLLVLSLSTTDPVRSMKSPIFIPL